MGEIVQNCFYGITLKTNKRRQIIWISQIINLGGKGQERHIKEETALDNKTEAY